MAMYRPSGPFTTPAYLLTPTYEYVKGVRVKKYAEPTKENLFCCSFKTYGGTEKINNDLLVIEDTAVIETWYDPRIKADCRIQLAESGATYEIIGEPEDISLRHQFLKFKVRRFKGGA